MRLNLYKAIMSQYTLFKHSMDCIRKVSRKVSLFVSCGYARGREHLSEADLSLALWYFLLLVKLSETVMFHQLKGGSYFISLMKLILVALVNMLF